MRSFHPTSATFFRDFYTNCLNGSESIDSLFIVRKSDGSFGVQSKSCWPIERFFRWIFWGTSYDLPSHIKTIQEAANRCLNESKSRTAADELVALSRTSLALQRIVKHVQEKKPELRQKEHELKSTVRAALVQAAALGRISPLALACSKGLFSQALSFITSAKELEEVQEHLSPLLQQARLEGKREIASQIEQLMKTRTKAANTIKRAWIKHRSTELLRVKGRYIDDPNQEQERLRDVVLLDYRNLGLLTQPLQIMFGRAMEAKMACRQTHYTFTHAQDFNIAILNDLMTRLESIDVAAPFQRAYRAHVRFRPPNPQEAFANCHEFFNSNIAFQEDNSSPDYFLSADAYHFNTTEAESAISYLLSCCNRINYYSKRDDITLKVIESYVSPPRLQRVFYDYLKTIQDTLGGHKRLCFIAIPKNHIQDQKINYTWHAKPYGARQTAITDAERVPVLERLQNDDRATQMGYQYMQTRILPHNLDRDRRAEVLAFDSLTRDQKRDYENKISPLVAWMKTLKRLEQIGPEHAAEEIVPILLRLPEEGLGAYQQWLQDYLVEEIRAKLPRLLPHLTQALRLGKNLPFSLIQELIAHLPDSSGDDLQPPGLRTAWLFKLLQEQKGKLSERKRTWIQYQIEGFYLLEARLEEQVKKFQGRRDLIKWDQTGLKFGLNLGNLPDTTSPMLRAFFQRGPEIMKQGLIRAMQQGKIDAFFAIGFDDTQGGCYENRTNVMQDFLLTLEEGLFDEEVTLNIAGRPSLEIVLGEYLRVYTNVEARKWAKTQQLVRQEDFKEKEWREEKRLTIIANDDFRKETLTSAKFDQHLATQLPNYQTRRQEVIQLLENFKRLLMLED